MISQNLITQIKNKILEEVIPQKIVIFGSQVRNDNTRTSDIDIALVGIPEDKIYLLEEKLNEEVDTLKDIDVLLFDNLKNERLKERIEKDGVIIYERGTQ